MIALPRICCQAATAIVVVLLGCSGSGGSLPDGHQVQSLVSPDGGTRAFVWVPQLPRGGLGATVSQPYQVWLESQRFSSRVLVVEGYKMDGFRLAWVSDGILDVCYADARIYKFLSGVDFAIEKSPEVVSIEIILRRVQNLRAC